MRSYRLFKAIIIVTLVNSGATRIWACMLSHHR